MSSTTRTRIKTFGLVTAFGLASVVVAQVGGSGAAPARHAHGVSRPTSSSTPTGRTWGGAPVTGADSTEGAPPSAPSSTTTTVTSGIDVSAGSAAPSESLEPTGSATGTALGVYAGGGDPQAVSDFASSVGAKPRYAMDFLDGTSWSTITQSGWPYSAWAGQGLLHDLGRRHAPQLLRAELNTATAGGSCYGLTQEAAGDFNADFATVAKNMVAAGFGSSVIRLGWEFNGGWFPWAAGGCASAFVGAFQQVVTAMRSAPGQSFTFEWNPTRGDLSVGNLANFYPGDAYVDDVGLDVYDVEWATYPGMPNEFSDMETADLWPQLAGRLRRPAQQGHGVPRVGTRVGDLLVLGSGDQRLERPGLRRRRRPVRQPLDPVVRHAQRGRGDLLGRRLEQHRRRHEPEHRAPRCMPTSTGGSGFEPTQP